MIKEFKPALLFLVKFLGVYFVGNIVYGLYIEGFGNVADPMTVWVSNQTVTILNLLGLNSETLVDDLAPKIRLLLDDHSVLSIYEGCNGLNVMIIFVAFLAAYSGNMKRLLWFVPFGLLMIHLMNLTRIVLLFFVAEYYEGYLYFTHKYLFTAVIYVGILILWYWWITKLSKTTNNE
jgi:exosortase family protein XrtF